MDMEVEKIQKKEKENQHNPKGDFLFSRLIVLAVLIGLIQISITLYDMSWKNDFMHEARMLSLDSIQVEQNNTIIKLLKKQPIRDTVVVHIVAPLYK
jgi:hypothetical protein